MGKLVISREEALKIGLSKYFTGKPCKYGHVDERYIGSRLCVACMALRNKKRDKENYRKYWESYCTEEVKNKRTEKARKRRELNPYKARKFRKLRKRRLAQATIQCEKDKIVVAEMYIKARRLTLETGIEHCVDHIIPLAHKDVCGLHTAANLQIMTSKDNRKKGTSFDPAEHELVAEKT